MSRVQRIVLIFRRERRPGDLVFAVIFLLLVLLLLSQLGAETKWVKRTKFFAQPAFWPTISLVGMALFAFLNYFGSVLSPRMPGRIAEVTLWLRSLEYIVWFLLYVWLVPIIGYLPATLIFTLCLTFRVGYRDKKMFAAAAAIGVGIVVVFKSLLQVKIPGGAVYQYLPDGLRNFMLLYL